MPIVPLLSVTLLCLVSWSDPSLWFHWCKVTHSTLSSDNQICMQTWCGTPFSPPNHSSHLSLHWFQSCLFCGLCETFSPSLSFNISFCLPVVCPPSFLLLFLILSLSLTHLTWFTPSLPLHPHHFLPVCSGLDINQRWLRWQAVIVFVVVDKDTGFTLPTVRICMH